LWHECIDAGKRSTYQAASIEPMKVATTGLVDWYDARIESHTFGKKPQAALDCECQGFLHGKWDWRVRD
jgi:hypothetical protein